MNKVIIEEIETIIPKSELVKKIYIILTKELKLENDNIFIKSKKREIVTARQLFQFILATSFNFKIEEIAFITKRDRTSIYNSIKIINNLLETDNKFYKTYLEIINKIKEL